MSAIITPFFQQDTGVGVFKTDMETGRYLGSYKRFIITPVPRGQAEKTADGMIHTPFSLESNETMRPFFENPVVFETLGGIDSLSDWVKGYVHKCQHREQCECSNQLTVSIFNDMAIRLCWHHENAARLRGYSKFKDILYRNRARWIIYRASLELQLPTDRDISMVELAFWAIRRGLKDELPIEAGRIVLGLPEEKETHGTTRESDITWSYGINEMIDILAKDAITLDVEEDSGLLYMKRPKLLTGRSPAYLRFVVSRPCVACGAKVNKPFLYRAKGLTEHDRWCVPLCDACAGNAAHDLRKFEASHGIRLYIIANQLFDFAIEHGVIRFGK